MSEVGDDNDADYVPDPDEGEWPLASSSDEETTTKTRDIKLVTSSPSPVKLWSVFKKIGDKKAMCLTCKLIYSYEGDVSVLRKHSESHCGRNLLSNGEYQHPRPSRLRSRVWEWFKKVAPNRARCQLCGTVLVCSGGNTGNLRRHAIYKHAQVGKILNDTKEIQRKRHRPSVEKVVPVTAKPCSCGGLTNDHNEGCPRKKALQYDDTIDFVYKRKLRSPIWQWFTRLGRDRARCNICTRVFSVSGGNAGNLHRHAQRLHPEIRRVLKGGSIFDKDTPPPLIEYSARTDDSVEVPKPCSCEDSAEGHKEGCPHQDLPVPWSYYDKIELQSARCRLCGASVSWSDAADLRRHLAERHPDQPVQKMEQEITEEVVEEVVEEEELVEQEAAEEVEIEPPSPEEVLLEEHLMDFSENEQSAQDTLKASADVLEPRMSRRSPTKKVHQVPDPITSDEWKQSLAPFGSYVASLMAMLPREVATRYQAQIVERLLRETTKY